MKTVFTVGMIGVLLVAILGVMVLIPLSLASTSKIAVKQTPAPAPAAALYVAPEPYQILAQQEGEAWLFLPSFTDISDDVQTIRALQAQHPDKPLVVHVCATPREGFQETLFQVFEGQVDNIRGCTAVIVVMPPRARH